MIDGDEAGAGAAALDLGRLLVSAHWNPGGPPALLEPDDERIEATLAGYCSERAPSPAERAALREAIQFGVVYVATNHLVRLASHGWGDELDASMRRTAAWFGACAQIADSADAWLSSHP